MHNPFTAIDSRLSSIEALLIDLKHSNLSSYTPNKNEKPLSTREAAHFLGISLQTLYDWHSKRKISAFRKGGRLYFFESDLIDFVRSGKTMDNKKIESIAESYFIDQDNK